MPQTSDLIQSYRRTSSISSDIVEEFKKSVLQNRFFWHKKFLIDSAKKIRFDVPTWHLRPEFFAYDYYGEANFFHIVLLVNDISSRFNFKQIKFPAGIIAPSEGAIRKVLSQNIS